MKAGVDEILERGTILERSLTLEGTEIREIAIDDLLAGDDLLMQGHAEDTLFQRDPHQLMAAALVYLIERDEPLRSACGKNGAGACRPRSLGRPEGIRGGCGPDVEGDVLCIGNGLAGRPHRAG